MKKNIFITACILLMIPFSGLTQDPKIYISAHAGLGQHIFEPGLLNDFVASYNKHNSSPNLVKEMEAFNSRMSGSTRGLGVYGTYNNFVWAFDYTKSTYSQSVASKFQSNAGQKVELKFVDWDYNFELGKSLGYGASLSALFGFGIRDAVIDSRTIYFDGESSSNGNEFPLNGVYRPIIMSKFNFGASMKIQIFKYLDLQIRAYNFLIPFGTQDNLSAFEDKSAGKRLTATFFPHDVPKFYQDWNAGIRDYQNNVIPFDFTGWQLSISMVAKFNLYKD